MKIENVILLTFLLNCLTNYLNPVNKSLNRYQNIYIPVRESLYGNGVIFGENYIVSPLIRLVTLGNPLDLCLDTKKKMQERVPEIWNSSVIQNPCSKYFCQKERPILLNSTSKYINIFEPLDTDDVLHYSLQTYCLSCQDSESERFDLFLQNTTCPWFNSITCNTSFSSDYECFYFSSIHPLFYSFSRDAFFAKLNLFHTSYIFFWFYYYIYFYLVPNTFFVIFNSFLLIAPEIYFLYSIRNQFINKSDAIKSIFNLRNQSIMMELTISLAYITGSILEAIGFSLTSFVNIVQYFQFLSILFSWTNLIILWYNIYNENDPSSMNNLSYWNFIIWIVLVVYSVIVFFLIVALFILLDFFSKSLVFQIIYAVIFLVCAFLLLIIAFVLIILSIRIYSIVSKSMSQKDSFFHTFKLKLTRNIFIFAFLVLFAFVLSVIGALCQVWPDLITWEGYSTFWVFGVIFLSNSFTFLSMLTLLNNEKIRGLYCCKPSSN